MNNVEQRVLYQLDQECAELYYYEDIGYEVRTSFAFEYAFTGGSFGNGTAVRYSPKAAPAKSHDGSFPRETYTDDTCMWTEEPNGSVRCIQSGVHRVAPTRGALWETTDDDVVLYHYPWALNYGDEWNEQFRLFAARSTDAFDSTYSRSVARECTTLNGWFDCADAEYIVTPRKVALALDNYSARSVLAWIHQDRSDLASDRSVRISIGQEAYNYWMPSFEIGVRSDVGPGLACKAFQAGGYDCIVAYTDVVDSRNTVRMKRFWSGSAGSTHYDSPVIESSEQFISSSMWHRTTSDIALWRHDSHWYIAFKPANFVSSNRVRVYRSPDGATDNWTFEGTLDRWSAIGPTVDATFEGNQRVWTVD